MALSGESSRRCRRVLRERRREVQGVKDWRFPPALSARSPGGGRALLQAAPKPRSSLQNLPPWPHPLMEKAIPKFLSTGTTMFTSASGRRGHQGLESSIHCEATDNKCPWSLTSLPVSSAFFPHCSGLGEAMDLPLKIPRVRLAGVVLPDGRSNRTLPVGPARGL